MKKNYIIAGILEIVSLALYYYFALPPINIQSVAFWVFISVALILFIIYFSVAYSANTVVKVNNHASFKDTPKIVAIPTLVLALVITGILLINLVCSPLFNASSYSKRISIDESGNFLDEIPEVNFNSLPLLDKDSSEKLGDRVMGQMSELVSQYTVSEQYTQINYNNEILRVTPLEYASFVKWITNRNEGVKGYITVNSVTGESNLK